MSSLNMREKRVLEDFLGMGGGYVLNFSDRIGGNRGWLVNHAVYIARYCDKDG